MNRLLVLILIYSSSGQQLFARAVNAISDSTANKTKIVRDSVGHIITYPVWQNMLKSGYYRLKAIAITNDSSIYVLEKQKESKLIQWFGRGKKPAESTYFNARQKIEPFNATDIEGKSLKLTDLTGKVVVLNFWFIGCPPCMREIPELNKLTEKYAGNDKVVFIAIALNKKSVIESFLKTKPFYYQIVDSGKAIADQYNIDLYPTNIVLNKDGYVMFHTSGYTNNTPYWISKTIDDCLK